MKAARVSEYGGIDSIHIEDIDAQIPSDDQVLIEVKAVSLNPFDTTIRNGYMKDVIPLDLPVTLGGDIAGVVTKIGQNVTDFNIGDNVYGQANVVAGNSGAFAEFAATKPGQIAVMPNNTNFIEAASLPLAGASAFQALTEHLGLQPDDKLFIHGGGGGIGTIAIQIAKQIGAYVATTATGNQIDLVKKLGADEVIDYKSQQFDELLSDFDAVFDAVGGEDFVESFKILKPGGMAVTMIAEANEDGAAKYDITAMRQQTHTDTALLDGLRRLVESGDVVPQVDKVFEFDDIRQAFSEKENGTVSGKIVLRIAQ